MIVHFLVRSTLILTFVASCIIPGCGGGGGEAATVDTVVYETYNTTTADGWTIALHRYRRSSGVAYEDPVFLSQGFLEGSKVFNAFPKYSLAAKLALDGYDVWDYDIRGVGDSQKPVLDWDNLEVDFSIDWTGIDFSIGMAGWDYCMDHFVLLDTPAALDFVLKSTGRSQVIWISHSCGGLMQYAYLQNVGSEKIKAAISLGGIGSILPGTDYQSLFAEIFFGIGTFLAPLVPSGLPLPLKWALNKLLGNDPFKWAAASYGLCSVAGKLFWNYENMNPNLVYQFLKYMLPDTTTNCFKQFMEWTKTGDCKLYGITLPADAQTTAGAGNSGFPVEQGADEVTIGKDYSVTQNLGRIKTPMLVLAGSLDLMHPASNCEEVFNRISSPKKEYLLAAKDTGHAADYGHVDMAMGLHAGKELYPKLTEFVGRYSTSR